MIFTKKDLKFLKLYASYTEANPTGQNFQIKKIDNNTIQFSQIGANVLLFTRISQPLKNIPDKYCYNFPTDQVSQLLNICKDDDSVIIEENTIYFGKSSKYEFTQVPYNINSEEKVMEDILLNYALKRPSSLKELQKISAIKYFIGTRPGLGFVSFINNHFVSSNSFDYGFVKTINNSSNVIAIPKLMLDIISSLKLKEVEILEDNEKLFFINEGTYVIIPKEKCLLENFFEDKWKQYYEFPEKINVKRENILEALNRINILAKDNEDTRISLSFTADTIKFESKGKNGNAEEIVPAIIDNKLKGHNIAIASITLLNAIDLLEEENLILQISPDKQAFCISVWQENKERFFVISLLPYED
jgi:hypothetical protein